MTYVLIKYSDDDNTEIYWCLCRVKDNNLQLGKMGDYHKFEVEKLVSTSAGFDLLFDPHQAVDFNVCYFPHLESDGKLYIIGCFGEDDNDEIFQFDNDADAMLYVEAKK